MVTSQSRIYSDLTAAFLSVLFLSYLEAVPLCLMCIFVELSGVGPFGVGHPYLCPLVPTPGAFHVGSAQSSVVE